MTPTGTKSAVLFIDFQVDVCANGGRMVSQEPDVLARFMSARQAAAKTLNALRDQSAIPYAFVLHRFEPGYPELANARLAGMERYVMAQGAFQRGSPGAEPVPELAPRDSETVFHKTRISAFAGTGVGSWLKDRSAEVVVIAGVVTHYAVLAAAISAHDQGFGAVVLKDACASADPVRHETALSILGPLAELVTTEDFLKTFA
ncbi:MAG: cysteine hydrolase [Alphaproteobacteria bacterium]|nr:cysteine hydrolase [Alphaproteobacteria bacterium]